MDLPVTSLCAARAVFDTLYHAVALSHSNAVLVTADERYYRRALRPGQIVSLSEVSLEAAP
jgi:hypothetical protein